MRNVSVNRDSKTGRFVSVKKVADQKGVWVAETVGGSEARIKVSSKSGRVIEHTTLKRRETLERLANR